MTPLNLFFVIVPFLKGSKSWKYYLYLNLLILVVLLISKRIYSTDYGIVGLEPVPYLKVYFTSVIYEKS